MDQKILDRFFKGQCSPEEVNRIKAWYLSGEADKVISKKVEAYWKIEEKQKIDHWGREALFEQINSHISESADPRKNPGFPNSKDFEIRWKNWSYAAAVALLMAMGGGWYIYHVQKPITQTSNQMAYISKKTDRGQKSTISLPDGTVVKLNAESRLWYAQDFGQNSIREIYLKGEAYLEVAEDPLLPFQIHIGNITTTVLGTSFNVKAFEGEDVSISVVSGKVKVEHLNASDQQREYLIPGEAAYLDKDTILSKRNFDYPEVLSWKDGTLYFKNARFSDIISTLERWYGVEIKVQRQGIENGFSGAYTHKSLERVLEGMSFVLDFDYEINDRIITIK